MYEVVSWLTAVGTFVGGILVQPRYSRGIANIGKLEYIDLGNATGGLCTALYPAYLAIQLEGEILPV